MTKITTFSAGTSRQILSDIEELKRRPYGRTQSTVDRSRFVPTPPARWARTCVTDDYPTYPSTGNVVGIEFGDYTFSPWYPGSTATETFTVYTGLGKELAYVATGAIPPLGTVVPVVWRNGIWTLLQYPPAPTTCVLSGGISFNSDGSNRNYVKAYDGAYSSSDRVGYVFFDYLSGDYSGVGLASVTSRSAVNGGTAETVACFSLARSGTYRFAAYISASNTTTVPSAGTVAGVTGSGGSPSHTHSFDYTTPRYYNSLMAMSIQSRLGAGAWSGIVSQSSSTQVTASGFSWYPGTYGLTDVLSSDGSWATSDAGREFRIKLTAYFGHDGSISSTDHAERQVSDGVVLIVSRVGDYAAAVAT